MITAATNTGTNAVPMTIIHPIAANAGPMNVLVPVAAMNRDDATRKVVVTAVLETGVAQHA